MNGSRRAASISSGPRPRIIVDTREKLALSFSDAVDVERATLPTGDYSVAGCTDLVTVERKSLADLVACVGRERERFEAELRRLEAFPVRALVIECTPLEVQAHAYRSLISPQSVLGSVVAWQVDRLLPVLWAGNAHLAAWMVERILLRVWRRQRGALEQQSTSEQESPDAA